ncbi:MAG: valine--tRNA ligase [Candidatus Bathyarchaeia archaeon]
MVKRIEAERNPLPKTYNPSEHEAKWQEMWQRWGLYSFDRNDRARIPYSIDTPPPYPSGEFHMGNALNWCYIDFVARYKRMRGFNVHFPQGWDCHGLPTEVRAERLYGVRKRDVSTQEFKELCVKLTNDYIEKMKGAMKAMGYSMDWSLEYRTMDPSYYRATQLSFLILYERGYIYRGEHPVNWCPRCETAIAEAEVVYSERESELVYLHFDPAGIKLPIATTRPELLPACVAVAVNPDDDRYKSYSGLEVEVPLIGRRVKVLVDEDVDPNFGTGVVMVCTFGDKTDVKWQKKYGLPVVNLITEDGRLSVEGGKYGGLKVEDARVDIIRDLESMGLLYKFERVKQSVGCCWRCHTPVEIISKKQWFMRTRDMTGQVLEWTERVDWIPQFSKHRMIDWARSLDWDWVISRQRVFATPIPVWYCNRCGRVLVARSEWLPVDPRFEQPKEAKCPSCGGVDFTGEGDVMDTWMDSSITCAVHAGWPDHKLDFNRLFPADLQPNGLDIIRTWDYYLMVKHLALFGEAPYKTVLVNGMVRGADGRMMHKSFGNYVEASEAISKYGADSVRQWAAAGAATGYDLQFNWGEVEFGKRFLTKLWNAARFVQSNLADYKDGDIQLELIDRWLMSKLQRLTSTVTEAYEGFQFNVALEAIREFTWHILCDQYLEAVKHRLYRSDLESPSRKAAQHTLYRSLLRIIQLLAPICPHICEAIYQTLPLRDNSPRSIHLTAWPHPEAELVSDEAERQGEAILNLIAEVRRIKSERHISLKEPVECIRIYVGDEWFSTVDLYREDIGEILNSRRVEVERLGVDSLGREVKGHPEIRLDVKI